MILRRKKYGIPFLLFACTCIALLVVSVIAQPWQAAAHAQEVYSS